MTLRSEILVAASYTKRGLASEECEDAFAIASDSRTLAVSDGATESSFSRLWATTLVKHAVQAPARELQDVLAEARKDFFGSMDHGSLPWHALLKLEKGTHATLLMIQLQQTENALDVFSVGDSCLGILKGSEEQFFPQSCAGDFDSAPYLLSTLAEQNDDLNSHTQDLRLQPASGETWHLFLMTDALGKLCLKAHARQQPILSSLLSIWGRGKLPSWLERQRVRGNLRNDDVTLILMKVENIDAGLAEHVGIQCGHPESADQFPG